MADDNAEDGESSMSSKPSSLKADLVSSESCEIASSKKIGTQFTPLSETLKYFIDDSVIKAVLAFC